MDGGLCPRSDGWSVVLWIEILGIEILNLWIEILNQTMDPSEGYG